MRFVVFCMFPGQLSPAATASYATADEAKQAVKRMGMRVSDETWYVVDTVSLRVRAYQLPAPEALPDPTEVLP